MDQNIMENAFLIMGSVLASSGFWAYLQHRNDKKDARTQLLIGLAHDRILYLGQHYIDRGWISKDEFENIHDYLYTPYEKSGGNGSAKRVMDEVGRLPLRPTEFKDGKR